MNGPKEKVACVFPVKHSFPSSSAFFSRPVCAKWLCEKIIPLAGEKNLPYILYTVVTFKF